LLAGKDVVGQSQTGSGKTVAFAVPAIEKVDTQVRGIQVLILCPTRELAVQVSEEVHKLTLFKRGIHALPIYGGQSYERQYAGLKAGAQIVIGTPGRVMDHMRRGTIKLDKIRMLVLDEADVMLDMGFRDDIEHIFKSAAAERQTVFFSATMPRPIQELIKTYSRDPVNVRIEQKAMTVPTVEQFFYEVDRRFKIELLTRVIDLHDHKLGIIFCNTKRMVDDLVDHLNAQGYSADRLHGDMSQAQRDRVMNKFRRSNLEFLVATDVAARGIDVDDIEVVFNFDLPYDVEDYVHRIGRTGRAGRSGRAISFVAGRELFQINQIERYTKMRIQRAKPPSASEVEEARAGQVLEKIRATLKSGEYRKQDHLIEALLEEGFSSTDIASVLFHHLQADNQPKPSQEMEMPPERRDDRRGSREPREQRDFRDSREPRDFNRDNDRRPAMAEQPDRPPLRPVPRPAMRPAMKPVLADRPALKPVPARPALKPVLKSAAPKASPGLEPTPAEISSAFAPSPSESRATSPAAPSPKPETASIPPVLVAEPRLAPLIQNTPAPADSSSEPSNAAISKKPTAPAKTPFFKKAPGYVAPRAPEAPKPKRALAEGHTRVFMSAGTENAAPEELEKLVKEQSGLPTSAFAGFDVRERHTFIDVLADKAPQLIEKLGRHRLKERRLKVKVA
jgi:ATP-dependent RNA helicase DeaD